MFMCINIYIVYVQLFIKDRNEQIYIYLYTTAFCALISILLTGCDPFRFKSYYLILPLLTNMLSVICISDRYNLT